MNTYVIDYTIGDGITAQYRFKAESYAHASEQFENAEPEYQGKILIVCRQSPKVEKLCLSKLIKEQYVGKYLQNLEFGTNEGPGSRAINYNQQIKDAFLETGEDGTLLIEIELEDGSYTYIYDNENVTVTTDKQ